MNRQQRLEEVVISDLDHVQRGEIQRIKDAKWNTSSDIERSDGGKEDGVSRVLAEGQILKDPDYE